MNDLVDLSTLFFKLVEDYHLELHYSKEANLYSTRIPGDQNQFVTLAGSLLSFGYLFGTEPYLMVAQTISRKNFYTNNLVYKINSEGLEKALRMYIEVVMRRYEKLMKKLKAEYEQSRLDKIQEDF